MLKRRIELPPEHLFPRDGWRIVEKRFSERFFERAETIFALGNGFVGIRGTFEEGRPALAPGTFVNGFHETWRIAHAEDAYGLAQTGQTIVNVPDATIIRLYVDDEPLFLPTARCAHYERVLDMRDGTLTREVDWRTPAGKRVLVRSSRLVSWHDRHLIAMEYEVTLPDDSAPIVISSQVVVRREPEVPGTQERSDAADPRLAPHLKHRVLCDEVDEVDGNRLVLGYRTAESGMTLGVAVDHAVETANRYESEASIEGDVGRLVVTAEARPGVPLRIVKYATYQTSRSTPAQELVNRCTRTLDRVVSGGYAATRRAQREQLDRFWDRADVRVEGGRDPAGRQQAIRWNLFQVGQASWRAEGAGVPAKGLTGQAYEGHYFWDTEVYVLPMLAYTQPRIARNLLRFRQSMLPKARERARVLSQRGAAFPWRTINGEEASALFQAGTAQYHINADIAYACKRYMDVCGDVDFLVETACEILVETARLWADLGFHGDDGCFHIHGVTGPDEYTTVVNDNAYTNLMARLNLNYAAASVRRLAAERPDAYAALAEETGLAEDEVEAWTRAADAMYVPYDEARGINPQDESFLDKEVWDLDGTPPECFPLMLHYHPLVIYRYQVLKQADVVLAMYLLANEFSDEVKRANFEYYDELTTGDSSLSACMQSIVAAEVGEHDRALEYFRFALLMDLADVAGNASNGVHIASAAGVWQALVFGFGGVRDFDGDISFSPQLPERWDALEFSLHVQGRQLRVRLAHDGERYELAEGLPFPVTIRGEEHVLQPGQPLELEPAVRS